MRSVGAVFAATIPLVWAQSTSVYKHQTLGLEDCEGLTWPTNVTDCQVCHYIQNKPPCLNTVQNIYANREALFSSFPDAQSICALAGRDVNGDGKIATVDNMAELKDYWYADLDQCGPICYASKRPWMPSKVLLNMCHMHKDKSCCYPVQDTEIEEHYFTLLEAGDRCKEELILPKIALRDIFCLDCHPDSGTFVVDSKVQICRSLAKRVEPELFDPCGMIKVVERGMPVYGDDSIIPSQEWNNFDDDGAWVEGSGVTAFLQSAEGAKPVFAHLEGFDLEVVEDCIDSQCLSINKSLTCFNPSAASATIVSLIAVGIATLIHLVR